MSGRKITNYFSKMPKATKPAIPSSFDCLSGSTEAFRMGTDIWEQVNASVDNIVYQIEMKFLKDSIARAEAILLSLTQFFKNLESSLTQFFFSSFDVQYLLLKQTKFTSIDIHFLGGRGYGIPFKQINIKKIFIFYKEKCTFDVSNFQIFLRPPTMVATEELRSAQLWDFPPIRGPP